MCVCKGGTDKYTLFYPKTNWSVITKHRGTFRGNNALLWAREPGLERREGWRGRVQPLQNLWVLGLASRTVRSHRWL